MEIITIGATWIYTRRNAIWAQQGSKLIGTAYFGSLINQGQSVALSYDGNTLVVGGPGDNGNIEATWIFTRIQTFWVQLNSKLVGRVHRSSAAGQCRGHLGGSHHSLSGGIRIFTLLFFNFFIIFFIIF